MRELTKDEYYDFLLHGKEVVINGKKIILEGPYDVKEFEPPVDFELERGTVWSFPNRGNWATHKGDYPGNWSPYVPRNILLKYSAPGDWVLDPMVGSGTTLIEAKLLGRNAIGIDINYKATLLSMDRLNFNCPSCIPHSKTRIYVGDARKMDKISDESVDLVLIHPPYANIIQYSRKDCTSDLSTMTFDGYIKAMSEVAVEVMRVLRPNKFCAILIGDTRKFKHYVPLSYKVLSIFLEAGFILKENIIKLQWNTTKTRAIWRKRFYDFYLIEHENLFIFRKPANLKEYNKFKFSSGGKYGKL